MNKVQQSINKASRSNFVTNLAWIFIVLSGAGTFISLIQNVMINFLLPLDKMREVLDQLKTREGVPALFIFLATYFRLIFLFIFAGAATTLTLSIGLLKRKNWARIGFAILMSVGIIWNICAVLIQQFIFPSILTMPNTQTNVPQLQATLTMMKIATIVLAAGFSILLSWVIKKLISPEIRDEFKI